MATTKRTPAPGEADKLIAHQSRLLKAPRIAAHYHRLAEQGRAADWSLEDYLGSVPGSGVSDGGVSVPDVRGPSRESLW